jgi:hypothetical protein
MSRGGWRKIASRVQSARQSDVDARMRRKFEMTQELDKTRRPLAGAPRESAKPMGLKRPALTKADIADEIAKIDGQLAEALERPARIEQANALAKGRRA